jgi:ResB-like family protein
VILLSAGITRYFGYEGVMSIREGSSVDYMYSRETRVQLSGDGEMDSFPVRLYRAGDLDIAKNLSVGGDTYKVELRDFWPHYENQYLPSESGPAALRISASSSQERQEIVLLSGENATVADVPLKYIDGPMQSAGLDSPWGSLQIRAGGDRSSVAVPDAVPVKHDMAGWSFEITEFQAAFRVGAGTNYDGPMTNPMIRVKITDPDGTTAERILFALHPEFSMSHNGQEDPFPGLDIIYSFDQGVSFARNADGVVTGRTSMALIKSAMGAGDDYQEIASGSEFPIETGMLYQTPDGTYSLLVKEIMDHVAMAPGLSQNQRAPAAGRIVVTAPNGETAQTIVIKNSERGEAMQLAGKTLILRLSPIRIQLPYSVHLDDFLLLNYPGSRNPASYESHVKLYDAEAGIDGRPVRIYMNHPLTHRGFKHFQSSYDPDERGTVLSVNYDPGKWPTYIGYILISLGFILVFARDLIWPPRKRNGGSGHEL